MINEPTMAPVLALRKASIPNDGPTRRSSSCSKETGNEPARNAVAINFASFN